MTLDTIKTRSIQSGTTDHSKLRFDLSNRAPDKEDSEFRVGVTYRIKTTHTHPETQAVRTTFLADVHDEGPGPPLDGTRYDYLPTSTGYFWDPNLHDFLGNSVRVDVLEAIGTHIPPVTAGSALAIKVTDDQEGCMIYDTDTAEIFVDSRLA